MSRSWLSNIFGGRTTKCSGLLAARIFSRYSRLPDPLGEQATELLSFLVIDDILRLMVMAPTIGMIDGRLHILVYTSRIDVIRVISLRKANAREEKFYARD